MDEREERLTSAACVGVVVGLFALILGIALTLGIAFCDPVNDLPRVTDKRFISEHIEIVEAGGSYFNVQAPEKYEIQLDGEEWVEVTEREYLCAHIGERFDDRRKD